VKGVRLTHIGGPTVLIEVGGWRLLTDPTFDPPGRRYFFGWGTVSRKLAGPAVAASDLPPIDAVLLTHDHHGDNLDAGGTRLEACGTSAHRDHWKHFREDREAIEREFAGAPVDARRSIRWLPLGVSVGLDAASSRARA
jgi:L-ascorbate metabolism protein UlaG (beta-lactamase superfamily)